VVEVLVLELLTEELGRELFEEFTLELPLSAGVLLALSLETLEALLAEVLLALSFTTLEPLLLVEVLPVLSLTTLDPLLLAGVLPALLLATLEALLVGALRSLLPLNPGLSFLIVLWWSLILLCSGCLSLKLL